MNESLQAAIAAIHLPDTELSLADSGARDRKSVV